MTTDQSDPRGLAAFHATASETVTHRPDIAGYSGQRLPDPLTLAYCLARAAYWQQRAAEIGGATLATPDEVATAEYWRLRAEEAERQIRAGAIKALGIDEDKEIV